jgi:hypothetical protein
VSSQSALVLVAHTCSLNKYGYMLGSEDQIALALEVMNMEEEAKDVVLTVTWEYIPSASEYFNPVQPFWFDVGGCGSSGQPAKEDSVFQYSSPKVKAPTSGIISMAAAHLHNGGTHLEVLRNGSPCCTSYASYENDHISEMTTCSDLSYSRGDDFSVIAYYNTSKHAPMTHGDGELEPVMGISIIYAVEDRKSHKHGKRVGGIIAAFFAISLVLSLGFVWYRAQRKKSKNVVPVWLSRQYKDIRSMVVGPLQNRRSRQSYEPLLDHQSTERH